MTEAKWLDFAGFLNKCIYGLENDDCPYLKFQQLDQFQKLECLLAICEMEAIEMIHCCQDHQKYCRKSKQKLFLSSLELELAP